MSQIKVEIPATLTNQIFGLGSSAIAVGLYDSFEIEESPSGLNIDITGFGGDFLSKSVSNTVVEVLRAIGRDSGKGISGLNIRISTRIPRGVGLGSGATAALAGALAANSIFGLGLSRAQIFEMTAVRESNAAAVAACLFGGMSIVAPDGSQPIVSSVKIPQMTLCVAAPILESPEITSEKSAGFAPAIVTRLIGLNALLNEAFRSGDYDLMRRLMASISLTTLAAPLQTWFPLAASSAVNEGAAFVMPCNFGPGVAAFAEKNHEAICGALVKCMQASYAGEIQSWIVPVNLHGISLSEVSIVSKSDTQAGSVVMSSQDL